MPRIGPRMVNGCGRWKFRVAMVLGYCIGGSAGHVLGCAARAEANHVGPWRDGLGSCHRIPSCDFPLHHYILCARASGWSTPFTSGCFCCLWVDLAKAWFYCGSSGFVRFATLLLTALPPVSLMLSGFHVNKDPVVVIGVQWSVHLADSRRFAWAAGALVAAHSIQLTALLSVIAPFAAAGAKRTA